MMENQEPSIKVVIVPNPNKHQDITMKKRIYQVKWWVIQKLMGKEKWTEYRVALLTHGFEQRF